MPKSAFNAIEGSVRFFLGGARATLTECNENDGSSRSAERYEFLSAVEIGGVSYLFRAERKELVFTTTEKDFIRELLTAFSGLFAGFSAKGYAAHFRTALLTSLADIAVARYIRGDRKGVFWPAQSLVQLLKSLSYQRYEGTPATTGFLICRGQLDDFLVALEKTRYDWLDLEESRRRISADFFRNPLSYRLVDGHRSLFVGDIRMNIKGTIGLNSPAPGDQIEQLAHRETLKLLSKAGEGSFAVYVNNASEVEIVLDRDRMLVWRRGYWGLYDPDIIREFLKGCLDKRSIEHLLWTVYALSKSRHGMVVLVADDVAALDVLRKGSVGGRDPLSRALIRNVRGKKIGSLKRSGELSRILSSDGLTVVNRKGELLDAGVIVDTSKVGDLVTGGGRTTAATSASYFGRVIKVSEDGPIELYKAGQSLYRFG
ncbi:hypothetical protein [uncultured Desulfuromusa sp.]|uniref:hypothetical protein n=1 Tax=uncultured Desulfuromusa sp. TaxID=219183 RepID=UPI002AA72C45|nr:hypothetical protein [uncultured Desulfuromusa sp.]